MELVVGKMRSRFKQSTRRYLTMADARGVWSGEEETSSPLWFIWAFGIWHWAAFHAPSRRDVCVCALSQPCSSATFQRHHHSTAARRLGKSGGIRGLRSHLTCDIYVCMMNAEGGRGGGRWCQPSVPETKPREAERKREREFRVWDMDIEVAALAQSG